MVTEAAAQQAANLQKDATYFNNTILDTTGRHGGGYYRRESTHVVNATIDDAVTLGTLTEDKTQLNVTAQVSAANPEHYYKFTLDGDSLKMGGFNFTRTANLRFEILNSNGKVIADSSEYASDTLKEAFTAANSSTGLKKLDPGDYYVKVTIDSGERRSVGQSYQLSLYSGTHFDESYATIAASQVKSTQHVSIDDTMTFSTLNALSYSNKEVHRANASIDEPVNLGWLYENKTALSVRSMLTDVADEHFYSVTLQKGDSLKLALDEKTESGLVRVQVMDPSGKFIYADSHGTDAQKEAYASLTSETGLDARRGTYAIKTSFVQGTDKSTDREYTFKVYAGQTYSSIYQTTATTETVKTALLQGTLTADYNPITSLASYLQAQAAGTGTNIMNILHANKTV